MSLSNTLPSPTPSFKWWYAVLIFVVANVINSLATLSISGDFEFYNNLLQPAIAPPDWLFPIIWFINNVSALVGLYWVANSTLPSSNKTTFYWAEASFWVLFSLFGFMYFYLGSVWLGAINTLLCFVVTSVSIASIIKHSKAWWFFLPRFLWLCLAVYVAMYMAVVNEDTLLHTGLWW